MKTVIFKFNPDKKELNICIDNYTLVIPSWVIDKKENFATTLTKEQQEKIVKELINNLL